MAFYGAYLAPGLIHFDLSKKIRGYREISAPGTAG